MKRNSHDVVKKNELRGWNFEENESEMRRFEQSSSDFNLESKAIWRLSNVEQTIPGSDLE